MKTIEVVNVYLVLIVIIALLAMFLPLLMYIFNGWVLRQQEIMTYFTDSAIRRYFETFCQADYQLFLQEGGLEENELKEKYDKLTTDEKARFNAAMKKVRCKFESFFSKCFGRRQFFIGGLLLFAITTFFLIYFACLMCPYFDTHIYPEKFTGVQWYVFGALAGFIGGYMWVIYFLLKRMQERNLSPADLYWSSARIVLAVPIALAFAALFRGPLSNQALYALCFMLGAFPLQSLITFMRRNASSKFNFQDTFDEEAKDLTLLQSVGRNQAETFAQEGVGTILNLAYCDPIDLTIRTGFSFSYVIDCCSQALALVTFDKNITVLRKYGLRGGQEIITFVYELNEKNSTDPETMKMEKAWTEKTLGTLAAELSIDALTLRGMLDSIAYDPYSQFLYDIWQPDWNS
jgi:hypothetical protein